jgi:hypothetical protein
MGTLVFVCPTTGHEVSTGRNRPASKACRGQAIRLPMFIAMNRFKVPKGSEQAFEELWLSRETHLDGNPGYLSVM